MASEKERQKSLKWYHNNKEYLKAYRLRVKMKLIEYKGGKCQKCGFDKPIPRVYDFHHRDPKTKEFTISGQKTVGFEKLKKEVNKCDMLCRNCHAEVHDNPEEREALMKAHKDRLLSIKNCTKCKKEFKPNRRIQTRCSNCKSDYKQPSKCPQKRTVQSIVKRIQSGRTTWTVVGRKYKVSDNAVRKWARKYELLK